VAHDFGAGLHDDVRGIHFAGERWGWVIERVFASFGLEEGHRENNLVRCYASIANFVEDEVEKRVLVAE